MNEFSGKVVLVTGASRGVGRQVALDLGEKGAKICVNYRQSVEAAKEVVKAIAAVGGEALECRADISDSAQVDAMMGSIKANFGGLDILVNSAGLSIDRPFLELTESDWDRVYEVNLKGAFLVSQAAARMMLDGGGVIVNISATTSIAGRPNAANYCSTKAGLNMLTRCMALELGPSIRVNGVGLGFVDSPLAREVFSTDQLQAAIDATPLKCMTTMAETSEFVQLLASARTSFVTGQTIMFDGGKMMR